MLRNITRAKWLAIFLTVFIASVAIRMVAIQIGTDSEYLNKWASDYGYELRTIQSERGYIYDRNGNLLAGNEEIYEVGVELQFVKNAEAIAAAVSTLLGSNYGTVLAAAQTDFVPGKSVYITVADFISSDSIANLEKLKADYEKANPFGEDPNLPSLRGLTRTPHLQRIYPENSLASNILGFYT